MKVSQGLKSGSGGAATCGQVLEGYAWANFPKLRSQGSRQYRRPQPIPKAPFSLSKGSHALGCSLSVEAVLSCRQIPQTGDR